MPGSSGEGYARVGPRPEGRKDGEVREVADERAYFPARSGFPVFAAVGAALLVVRGLWLFLVGKRSKRPLKTRRSACAPVCAGR
ncbi:cytochrome c oxidase subunit 4 [Streptomyces sp. SID11385]|uniref:aa3-type cytochrome oxidase subunit IV n=1 Tax=Streptomyces sp. SID11385 TaxID=2706031 RepID=UPI001EF239D5|nr:cytochrome c oxidase subunit 4 [Streptomyces sp. SID11385]